MLKAFWGKSSMHPSAGGQLSKICPVIDKICESAGGSVQAKFVQGLATCVWLSMGNNLKVSQDLWKKPKQQ
jgi:hypothetical protein